MTKGTRTRVTGIPPDSISLGKRINRIDISFAFQPRLRREHFCPTHAGSSIITEAMRGRNIDHAIIARLKRISSINSLTNELTFENVNTLFEGVDVCSNGSAGVKLTNVEFLMNRAGLAVDNRPAPESLTERGKGFWNFKSCLIRRANEVSGMHVWLLFELQSAKCRTTYSESIS